MKRFWSKVDRRGPDECWPWTASRCHSGKGYGKLHIGDKSVSAHRLSYELAHGPIPEGLCVLHSCDNKACCNPAHLSVGTHAENMRQTAERGIAVGQAGTTNAQAKLTEQDVIDIRAAYATGRFSQRELAVLAGVFRTTIQNIVNRERWKHI